MLKPVTSSNIKAVGYDEENKLLYVEFLNNTLYVYKDVGKNVYHEMLDAHSVGKYLAQCVKNVFSFERVR